MVESTEHVHRVLLPQMDALPGALVQAANAHVASAIVQNAFCDLITVLATFPCRPNTWAQSQAARAVTSAMKAFADNAEVVEKGQAALDALAHPSASNGKGTKQPADRERNR